MTLTSACAWVGFDATRKSLSTQVPTIPLLVGLMSAQFPFFLIWWAMLGFAAVEYTYWLPASVSLVGNVLANLLFIRAVRVGALGRVIPLLSLTPAITLALAAAVLGEVPRLAQGIGVVAVVLGALVLQLPRAPNHTGSAGQIHPIKHDRRAATDMFGVAILWSATGTLDKWALASAPAAFHALFLAGGMAALLGAVLLATRQTDGLQSLWTHRAPVGRAACFSLAATALQLIAYGLMYVAFVEAIKRTVGMIGAVLVGRANFGEALTRRALASVALMIVGVLLVVLRSPRVPYPLF